MELFLEDNPPSYGRKDGAGGRHVLVDTDTAQSLSNKTLPGATLTGPTISSPTITSPTISAPSISGVVTDTSVKNGPAPISAITTLLVSAATHAGKTVVLNLATGFTITLPAATGTGNKYRFVVGIAITMNNYVFNVTGNDTLAGIAYVHDEDTAAVSGFRAGVSADTDQMNLNGTTKGGKIGDVVEFEDVATDLYQVTAFLSCPAGSDPATPFATGQNT